MPYPPFGQLTKPDSVKVVQGRTYPQMENTRCPIVGCETRLDVTEEHDEWVPETMGYGRARPLERGRPLLIGRCSVHPYVWVAMTRLPDMVPGVG